MTAKKPKHPNSLANLKPFQPGHNGGRPKGSRNQLDGDFVAAMAADFQEHGVEAIVACRREKPDRYLKTIVALLPKEVNVSVNASETFERLLRAISDGVTAGDVGEGVSQEPGQPATVRH